MGALADLDAYKAALASPAQVLEYLTTLAPETSGTRGPRWYSAWKNRIPAGSAGANPTTAAVPDRTTVGALGQQNGAAGQLRLLAAQFAHNNGNLNESQQTAVGSLLVADRLSHQGGLSGTTTGEQTTNLATAALTRYTSGVGVSAAIEVYTAVGSTATTVSARYTNSGGTGSRATPTVPFGSTGQSLAGRFIPLPLQAGDVGVRSVEGVTLAASTLTAGNFGVTLYKPLMLLPFSLAGFDVSHDAFLTLAGQAEEILDDACLFVVAMHQQVNALTMLGRFTFAET